MDRIDKIDRTDLGHPARSRGARLAYLHHACWIACCLAAVWALDAHAASPGIDAVTRAQAYHRWQQLVEGAGIFWIAAEVGILHLVLAARRFVETSPLTEGFRFTRRERRRAWVWAFGLALLTALTFGRHWFIPRLDAVLARLDVAQTADLGARVAALYTFRAHVHMGVWAVFVTGWVLLEILIVFHGWRAYRRLRHVLTHGVEDENCAAESR